MTTIIKAQNATIHFIDDDLESVEKLAWNDYSSINSISKVYIDHITDKEALKKAVSWAKRSVE